MRKVKKLKKKTLENLKEKIAFWMDYRLVGRHYRYLSMVKLDYIPQILIQAYINNYNSILFLF